MKKRLRDFSKKKISVLVGVLAVTVVASATLVYLEVKENKDVAEAAELLFDSQLKAEAINKRLNSYFLPDRFLSEDVSLDKLTEEKEALVALTKLENSKSFEKNDFKNYQESLEISKMNLEELSYKLEKQNILNKFYEEPVLKGSIILKESIVKKEAKELTLDLDDNKYKDKWSKTIVELYDLAKVQINAMKQAEEAVATLFSQGKIEESVTREEYDKVAKKVNELNNPALKQALTDQIKPVLELIAKNEDAAKKIIAEEEASASGGTVEKQNDGSYLVVIPPEPKVNVEPEYTAPNPVYQNEPTIQKESSNQVNTNNGKIEGTVNKSTQTNSTNKNTVSSSNDDTFGTWDGGKDSLTGGDVTYGHYQNIEDIPGIEIGNPPW